MTWKINGVALLVPPTTGRWLPRGAIGRDGRGHPIYPGVREFEMRWDLLYPSGTSQLQVVFEQVIVTGTAVVEIPRYAYPTYVFHAYTGCVLNEPEVNTYFTENYTSVVLLISNIPPL
jgi:hypothetical protein